LGITRSPHGIIVHENHAQSHQYYRHLLSAL
jgi:hypothetical protein